MLVLMRRAAAGVATVLVGLGLVVLDPSGPSAMANVGAPPPLVVPSSVLTGGSLDMATAAERARMVGNVIPEGVTSAGRLRIPATVGQVATKNGPMIVGAAELAAGFVAATVVMEFVGVDNTGLTALFPDTTVQGYIPNVDARAGVAGWDEGISNIQTFARHGENNTKAKVVLADLTLTMDVLPTPSTNGHDNGRYPAKCFQVTAVGPSQETATRFQATLFGFDGQVITRSEMTVGREGQMQHCPGGFWSSTVPGYDSSYQAKVAAIGFAAESEWGSGTFPSTPQAIYRVPADPDRFPGSDGDPVRAWETRWSCSDSGSTVATLRSATFKESESSIPPYPSPVCIGEVTHVEVWEVAINKDADDVKVWEQAGVSPGAQKFGQKYPQCTDGSCVLELYRRDPTAGAQVSCLDNPSLCTNWLSDPNRAENYECRYAGAPVGIEECFAYGPTFNVWTGAAVQTESGTRPAERTAAYGDPATGEPVPRVEGDASSVPAPAPQPGGSSDSSCPPPFTWTSLVNPWWYYKGTVCALREVFVPKNSTAQIARIRKAMNATTPVVWSREVEDMFDVDVKAAGCRGPGMSMAALGIERRVYLFSACDAPMSTAAPWVKTIATVMLVAFGSMAAVRGLGAGFGWKPSAGGDG